MNVILNPSLRLSPAVSFFVFIFSCACASLSPCPDVNVAAVAELPRGPLLRRGNTVAVLCNVSVTTTGASQVEIQWVWKQASPDGLGEKPVDDDPGRVLASLSYDGVSRIYANGSELSVDRLAPNCYRLRIHSAKVEDQGHYLCQVAVWGQDPKGAWYNTEAKAESPTVRVYLYARGKTQTTICMLLVLPLAVYTLVPKRITKMLYLS